MCLLNLCFTSAYVGTQCYWGVPVFKVKKFLCLGSGTVYDIIFWKVTHSQTYRGGSGIME